jgi:hypothetical protein
VKVKNLTGTGSRTCRCANWLDHWKKHNTAHLDLPTCCPVSGCNSGDLVGAHVIKAEPEDKSIYICPLCGGHSSATDILEVDCALAPANVSETCGKWGYW